ncbi:Arm DNA-binding domain-containing protein [Lactiplantibacillus plantarum]|uniref:Arm DNA-binding domain-containing protein n=1 Tax=Lactiplantibacillus plantarum TaxID=1590 RepID=UPI0021A732F1|nr:Arm DNA-binding domain-containing protein [Lactiplantibacillus plantarum]
MASITKRSKTWTTRVSYYDDFGKRQFINQGGFRTKPEAQNWANLNEVDVSDGINPKLGKQLFTDCFLKWYQTYKEPTLAKSSRLRYQYTLGIVNNYFDGKRLDEITCTDYQKFLNDYANPIGRNPRSLSSSEKVNVQIKSAVQYAIDDDVG